MRLSWFIGRCCAVAFAAVLVQATLFATPYTWIHDGSGSDGPLGDWTAFVLFGMLFAALPAAAALLWYPVGLLGHGDLDAPAFWWASLGLGLASGVIVWFATKRLVLGVEAAIAAFLLFFPFFLAMDWEKWEGTWFLASCVVTVLAAAWSYDRIAGWQTRRWRQKVASRQAESGSRGVS